MRTRSCKSPLRYHSRSPGSKACKSQIDLNQFPGSRSECYSALHIFMERRVKKSGTASIRCSSSQRTAGTMINILASRQLFLISFAVRNRSCVFCFDGRVHDTKSLICRHDKEDAVPLSSYFHFKTKQNNNDDTGASSTNHTTRKLCAQRYRGTPRVKWKKMCSGWFPTIGQKWCKISHCPKYKYNIFVFAPIFHVLNQGSRLDGDILHRNLDSTTNFSIYAYV